MKQKLLLCLALLMGAEFTHAQGVAIVGSITSQASSCTPQTASTACVILPLAQNTGSAAITVSGTYSGTLQFEISADNGATWVSVAATPPAGGAAVTSTTSTGTWQAQVASYTYLRVRGSSYSSGTANVALNPSKPVAVLNNSVNGGAVPASATVLGSNSNGQLVDNSLIAPILSTNFGSANSTAGLVQNTVNCNGFITGAFGGTFTKVSYDVTTADNTANVYDLGVSNATSGALVCHTGPLAGTTLFPATGIQTQSWAASCSLAPNTKYYATLTSSAASPAAKLGGSLYPSFQGGNTCGASTSGTIPNTLATVPADAYSQVPVPALTLHN
jgi:hypothetical protein